MPGTFRTNGRRSLTGAVLLATAAAAIGPGARADDFQRLIGPPLFEVPRQSAAKGTGRLDWRAIESLPEVVRGERSGLIIATTDQGNVAKLLVSPRLTKPAGGRGAMVHVLNVDRYETIDATDRVARKARGRDVVLFDGFQFDLDTGQVVPAGFGGDLGFAAGGAGGPALVAIGPNKLYPVDTFPNLPDAGPGRPSSGPAVQPSDFNGRYSLVSNGQLSGALELTVADDGTIAGRFRSDRNGSVYAVTGRVAADLPRRILFEIHFPRSKQAFDGLLWTEEKNVFAGTVEMLGHPYSFVAVREGAALVPESIDAVSPPRSPAALRSSTRIVTMDAAGETYNLDGIPASAEGLAAALRSKDPIEVLIRPSPSTPFEKVQHAVRIVRGAGVATIRLAASPPDS